MKKKKQKYDENGFEHWGGYMNAKISKLEVQFKADQISVNQKNENISNIFQGISIFVNGYTEPSADELRCLMLLHGGIFHHYYRSGKTTHIIASSLPHAKFDQMKALKVVTTKWITESIIAGKLLDYKNYLLQNNLPKTYQNKKENLLTKFNFKKEAPAMDLKATKTAADKGYLTEFYNNSRLHYISTLASMLKQYVLDMRAKHNGVFPKRNELIKYREDELCFSQNFCDDNVIMHIDMDCFFVSVALRNYPHLKGQPVAVTHARTNSGSNRFNVNKKFEANFYKKKIDLKIKSRKGKSDSDSSSETEAVEEWSKEICSMSEIASCSYEARKFGVTKGMYLGAALKLCPNLKTVPYDFDGYREVSMILYDTVAEYTLDIEAVSCDELFIDCSNLLDEVKISPFKFAQVLREELHKNTHCTSSVGIAGNKLQARLATKQAKPNGQFYITPDRIDEFMKDLKIYEIPGVGRTIGAQLKALSVKTCGDLQKLPMAVLKREFGTKTGEALYKHCRGIDERKVNFSHERKSVSAEINYGIRFNDNEETEIFLNQLSSEVSKRLKEFKMIGKMLTFKIMFRAKDAPIETAKFLGHGACDIINRSASLPFATDDSSVIAKHVIALYYQLNIPANELRGIGIQITKLENAKKSTKTLQAYFDQNKMNDNFKEHTLEKVDTIRKSPIPSTSREIKLSVQKQNLYNDWLLPSASQLDIQVLAALPQDIRTEILTEYKINIPTNITSSEGDSNCDNNHQTKEEYFKICEATQSLFNLNLNELKKMIKEWVNAESQPKSFDINLLKAYFINLVEKKKLEGLSTLIRSLHRHINSQKINNAVWYNIYNEIVDAIQVSMMSNYGKPLATEILFI